MTKDGGGLPVTCPVCASPVTEAEKRCPLCDTFHHACCWEYFGTCSVFGCGSQKWGSKAARDTKEFEEIKERLGEWLRLYQVAWTSFGVFLTTALVLPATGLLWMLGSGLYGQARKHVPVSLYSTDLLARLGKLHFSLVLGVLALLMVGSFLANSVSMFLESRTRYRLEEELECSFYQPDESPPAILAMIEFRGTSDLLVQLSKTLRYFVTGSIAVVAWSAPVSFLLAGWGGFRDVAWIILPVLVIEYAALSSITEQLQSIALYMAVMNNRIAASAKKGAGTAYRRDGNGKTAGGDGKKG